MYCYWLYTQTREEALWGITIGFMFKQAEGQASSFRHDTHLKQG